MFESQRSSERISFRLTKKEKEKVIEVAAAKNLKISEYIKQLIKRDIEEK